MHVNIRRPLSVAERNAMGPLSEMLAHLLFHRGIESAAEAEVFLSSDYDSGVHDPFLLKDAEKAAERIIGAIKKREKIAIYSDYDADGIPGAAIWADFFRRIGFENAVTYIPHRHDEGFGINRGAIEELSSQGVKLVVSLDCGITDVGPVARANELGMEVIITDHHEPPPVLPEAFAIIDHKQKDCAYPDKNLCGSGVAFKLIQAILKKDRLGLKDGMEKWLLDLVGIATMSDMVALVGENRIFALYGLKVLRMTSRKGIVELLRHLRMNQKSLTEDDVAFMITPRINAASRMGVPMDAFRLLSADSDVEARACAEHLDTINNERKGVVASLVKEVKKIVRERCSSVMPSVIVLGNPDWRPSLLGLAANSCAKEFGRPVFLWGRDGENLIKGSCRSEGVSSVVRIMRAAPVETFSHFGGHHHSGGFGVINDQIHYLENRLNEAAEFLKKENGSIGAEENGNAEDFIDMELRLDDVNNSLFDDVNKLAPFGVGNPKPVFLFRGVSPITVRRFGKGNDHVELTFRKSGGSKLVAIAFFGVEDDWAKDAAEGKSMDLEASLERSYFRGRPELRLRIDGARVY